MAKYNKINKKRLKIIALVTTGVMIAVAIILIKGFLDQGSITGYPVSADNAPCPSPSVIPYTVLKSGTCASQVSLIRGENKDPVNVPTKGDISLCPNPNSDLEQEKFSSSKKQECERYCKGVKDPKNPESATNPSNPSLKICKANLLIPLQCKTQGTSHYHGHECDCPNSLLSANPYPSYSVIPV